MEDKINRIEDTIRGDERRVVQSVKTRRKVSCTAAGLIAMGLLAVGAAYYVPNYLLPYEDTYVLVKDDMTAKEISDELHDKGLVAHPTLFRLAAMVTGQAGELKKGEYRISTNMSIHEMLGKITSGHSEAEQVVIPEGYTVRKIAKLLDERHIVSEDEFLAAANDSQLLYPYMKGNRKVSFVTEGFLFPDTYFIPTDSTGEDIVKMMLKNFDDHVPQEMKEQIGKTNLSIYQFVTLASLIEKEAKFEQDRPLIASVFLNRLQKGMKLQSDASISYAMGSYKTAYSIDETEYDSPYNTYRYAGLPPGPICNPGLECMTAILKAPKTEYLYFVADKDGHNHFAVTYDEHMNNVEAYMP